MNPKAQLMGTRYYVKRANKETRVREARDWKRDQEVARYR